VPPGITSFGSARRASSESSREGAVFTAATAISGQPAYRSYEHAGSLNECQVTATRIALRRRPVAPLSFRRAATSGRPLTAAKSRRTSPARCEPLPRRLNPTAGRLPQSARRRRRASKRCCHSDPRVGVACAARSAVTAPRLPARAASMRGVMPRRSGTSTAAPWRIRNSRPSVLPASAARANAPGKLIARVDERRTASPCRLLRSPRSPRATGPRCASWHP